MNSFAGLANSGSSNHLELSSYSDDGDHLCIAGASIRPVSSKIKQFAQRRRNLPISGKGCDECAKRQALLQNKVTTDREKKNGVKLVVKLYRPFDVAPLG